MHLAVAYYRSVRRRGIGEDRKPETRATYTMSISKRRNHIVKSVSVRLIVAPQRHPRGAIDP